MPDGGAGSGAVLEALEALGLPDELPAPRRAEELFLRFQALVPYESASREGLSCTPEGVLSGFLESGAGAAGAERAEAFGELARAARVELERVGATWRDEEGHARRGTAFRHDGGSPLLLDPGLPLPFPLRLDSLPSETSCGWGRLSLKANAAGLDLSCEARGRTWSLATYGGRPEGVESDESDESEAPYARRVLEDRTVTLRAGRVVVSDAWSVLDLPAPPAALVRDLLGTELPEGAAELLAGSTPAPIRPPTLAVFHRAEAKPPALLGRLATPAGYLSILPPETRAEEVHEDEAGFTWTLAAAGAFLRRERVQRLGDGIAVEVLDGRFPLKGRRYVLEADAEGTLLCLRAELAWEVPPRGLAETVRRALVFHTASELLAVAEPGFLADRARERQGSDPAA